MAEPYGTNPPRRSRGVLFKVAVTVVALILVVVVSVVAYNVLSPEEDKPAIAAGSANAIRVASPSVVTKEGTGEPKVVLSLYEDFLCPYCRRFEEAFGPTVNDLIDSGTMAADYYMVAILDSPRNQHYPSRAGGAAYCLGKESTDVFRRFHATLYAQQPSETGTTFPTNDQIADTARQDGADTGATNCIGSETYVPMVQGLVRDTGIHSTPTVRINGADYDLTTPEELARRVRALAAA